MIRQFLVVLVSFLLLTSCKSQGFEKVSVSSADSSDLYVNDGDSTELYYLKLVPSSKPIGAVVVFPSGGESVEDLLKQIDLPELAYQNNVLTIIPSMNWGTESREVEIQVLDRIFNEVVVKHQVPKENFVLGGLSNGGMISLTYAERAVEYRDSTFLVPRGVFGLDVPLDKAHLYEYCQREIRRDFSEIGMNEARWMINNFEQSYGGSPEEFPDSYVEASIYSYGAENGGNAQYLKDMPIRMYTDLDVDWLVNERRRDLYDWNGTDIVAMINELKLMGNQDATVIVSSGKGVRLNGQKHPHSWSIMEGQDCMDWVLKLFQNEE